MTIGDWVQTIIVAVAVATIIEMILPNGNSKKYIKMVLGIFIVFNIVSPLISKITGTNLKISEIVNLEKYIDKASAYEIYDSSLEKNNQSNILCGSRRSRDRSV